MTFERLVLDQRGVTARVIEGDLVAGAHRLRPRDLCRPLSFGVLRSAGDVDLHGLLCRLQGFKASGYVPPPFASRPYAHRGVKGEVLLPAY